MAETFGNRLRLFRVKIGLSQQKLADYINVSLKTVQRWEKNERQPRIEEIKKLALALRVSEFELFNDDCSQPHNWVLNIRMAQNLQEEVIDLSKGIPRIATITTTKDGGLLTLGGSYDNWTDDNCFKKLLADLKKFRGTVIQNGIALGGIKE